MQSQGQITVMRIRGGEFPVFLLDGGEQNRFVRDSAGVGTALIAFGLEAEKFERAKLAIYGILPRLNDEVRSETVVF